ncbi:AraC family transcriptional regulator [Paenibacillus oryzae]|nr:ABC transporter substrate-binding protein [Paenibacillus oryzae]
MLKLSLDKWLYSLKDIQLVTCEPGSGEVQQFPTQHTLIAIMSGNGAGQLEGKYYRLRKGGCFLLPPSGVIKMNPDDKAGLSYCLLELDAAIVGSNNAADTSLPFPFYGKLDIEPFSRWKRMLEELLACDSASHELAAFERHILLQQLLFYLYQRNWLSKEAPYAELNRILDMLHSDPTQDYSVTQLALKANSGLRQFTSMFKEMTGLNPLDYIARLRINRAKRQLVSWNGTLNGIASSVGYQDVYYFSRRFKQIVGESPKQYASRKRDGMRIVALYYSGTVIAMGVTPVGANLTWWGGSAFLREREAQTVDLGVSPTLEQIAGLKPDLILLNDHNRHHYEQLQSIAPAVFIPYDGHRHLYEETRMLGRIVGNPQAAERFIVRYERKASAIRRKLKEAGVPTEQLTAVILRIQSNGSQFAVFGDNYGRGGWSIYRGLRFNPPLMVQRLIDNGDQIRQNLPISALNDYAWEADYIFVVNEGEGIRQIEGREGWRSLPAVAGNRVFELSHEQISYFDPISIEGQLDLLGELLQEAGVWNEIK